MNRDAKNANGKLENGKSIMRETCPDKKNRDAKNTKGET
jgi:hypothetical protein